MSCVPSALIAVSKPSFLAQSAAIATTTLFTPDAEGDYAIAAYGDMVSPTVGGSTTVDLFVSWTDEYAARGPKQLLTIGSSNLSSSGFAVYHLAANEPLQFSTSYSATTGAPEYDLYFTVIKL